MAAGSARHERARRRALRAAGLRPVEIWVPDVRRRGFADECRRQSSILVRDPHECEMRAPLKAAAAETEDWT